MYEPTGDAKEPASSSTAPIKAGIEDVFVWDRAFYPLDYYPEDYLIETDNGRRLNLR